MTSADLTAVSVRAANLRRLIDPQSVAILGASPRTGHFANQPLVNLRRYGFGGEIFPVNPKYDEVEGYRCYPGLGDLPSVPDLVVIVVRPGLAVEAVELCGELGVGGVVVVGSGFAEMNTEDGHRLQSRLLASIANSGVRLCGPNTLGVANFYSGAVAYASGNLPAEPRTGSIAIVSQSGGCSFTLLNRAWRNGIGVGHVAVAGNELDVTIPDFIEHYLRQSDVTSVACYMEAVRDPAGLRRVGELAAGSGKSVFVMKSGSSELGQRAAAAHTGALATTDSVCDAALEQWGLIRARTFDELISAAAISARYGPAKEQGFGVYAQGGGLAVVASDLFDAAGLTLAEITPSTVKRLKARMPDTTPANPFDSGGQFLSQGSEVLTEALNEFMGDSEITAAVYMLMPVAGSRLAIYTEAIVAALRQSTKPSVVLQYGAGAITQESTERIVDCGVPLLDPPEAGISALRLWSGSASVAKTTDRRPVRRSDPAAAEAARLVLDGWRGAGRLTVSEYDVGPVLDAYGIDHVRQRLVTSEAELDGAVNDLTAPYVVKVASDDILHRSDFGGVRLGLTDERSVREAYREVLANAKAAHPEAVLQGVTVCETVPAGLELIIGITRDDTFGPVVMLGVGGIHAEMWQDTALCLPPLADFHVESMIGRLRSAPLLRGTRGMPGVDLEALHDLVIRVGELALDLGDELVAFEMNPVIASPTAGFLMAADALLELAAAT